MSQKSRTGTGRQQTTPMIRSDTGGDLNDENDHLDHHKSIVNRITSSTSNR